MPITKCKICGYPLDESAICSCCIEEKLLEDCEWFLEHNQEVILNVDDYNWLLHKAREAIRLAREIEKLLEQQVAERAIHKDYLDWMEPLLKDYREYRATGEPKNSDQYEMGKLIRQLNAKNTKLATCLKRAYRCINEQNCPNPYYKDCLHACDGISCTSCQKKYIAKG